MKFGSVVLVILFIAGLSFMVYMIVGDRREIKKYRGSDLFAVALDSVLVKGSSTRVRGVILIRPYGYVSVNSKLIDNPDGFTEWDSHAPIISFEEHEYITKLWDVPFPYYLSKNQNSDTIIVDKDGFTLYFRLYTSE